MSAIVKADAVDIAGELPQIFRLAGALKQAGGFLPRHVRNEGELVAIILAGRELGIAPMAALRSIHLVEGKVTLSADTQLALMVRAGATYQWLSDGRNGTAQLKLTRHGQPSHVQTYTLDDAKTAGLLNKDVWRKYPHAMLRARCVSAAARAYFPDVLSGVYIPEELDSDSAGRKPADVTIADAEFVVEHDKSRKFGDAVKADATGQPLAVADVKVSPKLDEYGLEIPPHDCPVVRPGKPNAGKRWDQLNGPVIEKMYAEAGDKMTDAQRSWAEYLMARRQARKAREAAAKEAQDTASEGGSWVMGDEMDPPPPDDEPAGEQSAGDAA